MTATITPTIPESKVFTKPRMATGIPASITTPDRVDTRLGTLEFFDGFPGEKTVETLYDNLDFQRGVQAFLTAIPAASAHAMREGFRTFGPDNETVLIAESLMDSHTLGLTGNSETVYTHMWLDTKAGPLVIELPTHVLGVIDDSWFRFDTDVGHVGPDKGEGGKYLLLPPGYAQPIPEGYFVVRSRTYGHWFFFRGFIENGDLKPAIENAKKNLRVYPLDQAANPPALRFVNMSGVPFNTIHSNDFTFFEEVADAVREEPLDAVDPETRGLLAAIGIRKDQPFAPDERMKRILADAAAVGNATARAIVFDTRDPDAFFYPDSKWKTVFVGGDYQYSPNGVLNLDARTLYLYMGTGNSPAWMVKKVGLSSQYAMLEHDAAGEYLDGARNYRLHLPANIPAKDFWSLVVYDPQTRSMLQTDQRFPSTSSQKEGLIFNSDRSLDIYFGPEAPSGKEGNWVQTIAGKGWFVVLRLYGPLEPWFDKTWRPGEIERIW